ncbi:MAG TPA: transporter substrate-binding domain-containing protein, partial [Anaerolineales bacterium]|nr:transporter substrate-binding domain-containing protein [Anaerolineales bacterium]
GYNHTLIPIAPNQPFICPNPECGQSLQEESQGAARSSRWWAIAVIVLVVIGGLAVVGWLAVPRVLESIRPGPSPSPGASPTPNESACVGPIHKNAWADIKNRGYLIMGVQASAPPMNDSPQREKWDEEQGDTAEDERRQKELYWTRTGFDYELAKMIAAELGLIHKTNVRAREVSEFKDLFCLLNRQEKDGSFSVDIIMSGIARDSTYDDTISWSKSYAEFGYALVTKKSSYIETVADLKNKKIGIVKGDNIVKAYVAKQFSGSEIIELSDESDEWLSDALNLPDNHVEAVVYDYPFAVEELKGINQLAHDEGVPGKLLEIRIASLPNSELKYSIGVPRGEEDLLAMINDALDKITDERNPRYATLIQKYFRSGDITPVQITSGSNVYIVQKGESLSLIAAKVLNKMERWRELATLNNIANVHLIFPGQKLLL